MNALKTLVMVAFLGAVGYVVYLSITKNPRHAEDLAAQPTWSATPKSQLAAPGSLMTQLPASGIETSTSIGSPRGMPPMNPPGMAPQGMSMSGMSPSSVALPPMNPPVLAPAPGMPTAAIPGPVDSANALLRSLPPPPATAAGRPPEYGVSPPAPMADGRTQPTVYAPSAAASLPIEPATGAPQASGVACDAEMLSQFETIMNEVRSRLDRGLLAQGLQTLTRLYEMTSLPEPQLEQVAQLLGQVSGTVVYSPRHVLRDAHVAAPGETLARIATRYQITPELLSKINGLDPSRPVEPGQRLKVLPGPFSAVVWLDRHELLLYVDGLYAGRFPIGLGQDPSQLAGEYGVRDKIDGPVYRDPQGVVVQPHDPNNPLGHYAIDLGNGLAIHGTNDPSAIGRTDNRGAILLNDRDLHDVYDILTIGSRVTIQR